MSPGLSNSYLLQTDDGRIIVNTGMGFEGPLHRRVFDAVDAAPTRAIVLTQGHYDHVGGIDCLRDEGTEVIAQANFATWRADNERLEAFRVAQRRLRLDRRHPRRHGARRVARRREPRPRPGPEPTTTFEDRLELAIGGRELVLLSTPGGETTDSLVVWLPESPDAFTGNLFGPLFGHVPNLVTMRGDRYRDALAYIDSLDLVLELAPTGCSPATSTPSTAPTGSPARSTAMRDATQWVHDRTVEGMNAGTDVHTLCARSPLPTTSTSARATARRHWNVRAIWENYAGLVPPPFHHRALRRAARGGGAGPGGRGRCRTPWSPRPGHGSTPASRWRRST